jgi:predicted ester cyclase
MDAEQLKDLYRRWLTEVWGNGNYQVVDEVFAADIQDHNSLPGQPAGRAGQVWAARMVRDAFPDLAFTADVVVSDGEYVTGRWTMTGTNTGTMSLFGIPPTGRRVTMTGQEIFRAAGGVFVEVWHQEDVGGMLTSLGLEPPPVMMRLAARRSARRYRRELRRPAPAAAGRN